MTIWKYLLEIQGSQAISMPVDSTLLRVQFQQGRLCLWAVVDPKEEQKEIREIHIYGTGQPIDSRLLLRFLGTVQDQGNGLVWHVFENCGAKKGEQND